MATPYEEALKLIHRRDRFVNELCALLIEKGFEKAEVSETLEKLESQGLLDDRRTGEGWIRHYSGKNARSKELIQPKLLKLGADPDLTEDLLRDVSDLDLARNLAKRRKGNVGRFLYSRGFDAETIESALSELT